MDGNVVDVDVFVQGHEIVFDYFFRWHPYFRVKKGVSNGKVPGKDARIHGRSGDEVNHGEDEKDDVDEGEASESFIFLDVEQFASGIARNTNYLLLQKLYFTNKRRQ